MKVRVVLVALNVEEGKALILEEGRLRLVSRSQRWFPLTIGSAEKGPGLIPPDMIPVGKAYDTFSALRQAIENVCSRGLTSSEAVRWLLGSPGGPTRSDELSDWTAEFPSLIRRFDGRVKEYFLTRGCSSEERAELTDRVFRRLYLRGPLPDREVFGGVLQISREVFREARGDDGGREQVIPQVKIQDVDETLFLPVLSALDSTTLEVLVHWADPRRLSELDVAQLLRLSLDEIRARIQHAVDLLGLASERLRNPGLRRVYLEALRSSRLAPKHSPRKRV